MEETNKPRLFFIVKAPIIIVSIIVFVIDYNKLIDYYLVLGNHGGLLEYFKIAFSTTILRSSLLMLIPLIGVFFNRKIGWLLILSFYYFWIILLIYSIFTIELERSGTIVIAFGAIIILMFFIGLMNSGENRKSVYEIGSSEQLKMNFVSFLIALIGILLITIFNYTRI
jgi:hypothetical protein